MKKILILYINFLNDSVLCAGLIYKISSGGGHSIYIYCVVSYHVIAAPCVRSVGCAFALLYTLVDHYSYSPPPSIQIDESPD